MSQQGYTEQITRLIEQQGRDAAAAADRKGQIWGGALANLGQIPAQVQAQQRQKQRDALQQQELGLRTQQLGLEVDKSTQEKQDREAFDKILSNPEIYNPDHTINQEFLAKAPIPGHLRPKFDDLAAHLDETQTAIAAKRQALADSQNEAVGRAMLKVEAAGNDPNAFGMALTSLVASGAISPTAAKSYQARATDPAAVGAITKQLKAGTKSGELDLQMVPAEAVPLDKRTGKPLEGFTPTEKPKDEFNTFKDTYAKTAGKTSWNQLSPTEQAAGFKAFVEAKADPAAQRQANALDAQTRTQAGVASRQIDAENRRQNFASLTAARADIQKNADTPYQTAKSAADELRGLVEAAKSGNKIAASEQNLATAAATIRGFGLNRINMAEIGMPATAGSAADRVANFIGKWKDGQPVNENLQKDMIQIADTLEAVARKKYEATHAGINKLYKTSIPQTYEFSQPASGGAKPSGIKSITEIK